MKIRFLHGLIAAALLAAIGCATTVAPPQFAPGVVEKHPRKATPPVRANIFRAQQRQPGGFAPQGGGPAVRTPLSPTSYLRALQQVAAMPRLGDRGFTVVGGSRVAAKSSAVPSWTALGPTNFGGRTRALVIDPVNPQTMYAGGVGGGVWKSTDGGDNWAQPGQLVPNIAVSTLAMDPRDPNVLYAGTGEGLGSGDALRGAGIFKTPDGGATWTQLASTNTPDFYYVNKIIVSPNNSQVLYAATRSFSIGGVWRSTDGGGTWSKVLSPKGPLLGQVLGTDKDLPGGCTDLAVRTDTLADWVVASCGVRVSDPDNAAIYVNMAANSLLSNVWGRVHSEAGMDRTSLAISPSNQLVMYALAASSEAGSFHNGLLAVLKSTNGGLSWTATVRNTSPTPLNRMLLTNAGINLCQGGRFINQGTYDNVIAVDPVNSDRVWAGGINLFRSDDGGANFALGERISPHPDQHAIVFPPGYDGITTKHLYVTNDGGIEKTPDATAATNPDPCLFRGGIDWTPINNGYQTMQFYHGIVYPDGTRYNGGTQDNGMRRNNVGTTVWDFLRDINGDAGYSAVDPTNTNVLFALNFGMDIRKSTDGGGTFTQAMNGITSRSGLTITPLVMAPTDPKVLWTGGQFLWRTTNQAGSWVQASAILPNFVSAIAVAPGDANTVLVGTTGGHILRSTSALSTIATTNWDKIQLGNCYISSLAFDPANVRTAYATTSTFGCKHIWKTTDGGANWNSLDDSSVGPLPDVPVTSVVLNPGNPDAIMLGSDIGVFLSMDGGARWATANAGIGNAPVVTLAHNAATRKIVAFTHGLGAWSIDSSFLDTIATAPKNLTATAGNGQVTLNWAASGGATSYNVYQGISPGGEGSTPVATGITGTSRTITGLTNDTTYYFKVAAVNASGTSPLSNEANARPVAPPPAPTNLTATAGNGRITLNWAASAGATSYNLYRGASAGAETLVVTGITATSRTITGLINGTTYFFQVAAVNAGGTSPRSNRASATPQGPPPAPTNLTATPGNGLVTLNWAASAGATSYNLYQGTSPGAETLVATGITGTSRTVTGLINGRTYFFKVAAVNASGIGPLSNGANATPATAPPAPTNLTATAGNGQVTLNWAASAGATSYNLYQGTSPGGETLVATGITGTSSTIGGLSNGRTYFFKVAAVNASGISPLSNGANATPAAAPPAPTNLTATAGNGQVSLNWAASAGATSYNVYQGTSPGGEGTTPVAMGITGTSRTIGGLSNGTTYYFKVAAVNASATSPLSNEASATPQGPPPAPTNLSANPGNGSATLVWTNSPGAASYNIYMGTTPGGQGSTPVATTTSNFAIVSGLTNGRRYYFKVAAVNAIGTGALSSEASTTPMAPPPAPTNLTATPGSNRVSLSWNAAPGSDRYYIFMSTTPGGQGTTPVVSGVAGTSWTVTGLTNGTTYYFTVAGENNVARGPQSSEASATPRLAAVIQTLQGMVVP